MKPKKKISFAKFKKLIFDQANSKDQEKKVIKTVKLENIECFPTKKERAEKEECDRINLKNVSLHLVNCQFGDFFQFSELRAFDAVACDFGYLDLHNLAEECKVSLSECMGTTLSIHSGYLYEFSLLNSGFDSMELFEVNASGAIHDFDQITITKSLLLVYSKNPFYIDCSPEIAPLVRMACPTVPIKVYVAERPAE